VLDRAAEAIRLPDPCCVKVTPQGGSLQAIQFRAGLPAARNTVVSVFAGDDPSTVEYTLAQFP
jgi:hypothetical protein